MVNATLERPEVDYYAQGVDIESSSPLGTTGGTVTIPLLAEGGQPVIATDYGKPNQNIREQATPVDPRHVDQWSGLEQYTLLARYTSDSAYSDVIDLINLIKSHSGYENTTLNINVPEYDTDMTVAPSAGQDQALTVVYNPGRKNNVEVDLGLTRVKETVGVDDETEIDLREFDVEKTPTTSGSGPITLSDPLKGTSVELSTDITVQRSVGRPNSTIRKTSTKYPNHYDKRKVAFDSFDLSFRFVNNVQTAIADIVELISTTLGRTTLTLDFGGIYGMGSFSVVPDGSQALRHARHSGKEGVTIHPTLTLRRVYSD